MPGQSLFATNNNNKLINGEYAMLSSANYANEIGLRLGIDGIGGNAIQLNNNVKQEYTSDFKWSGCSDNIKFAFSLTKQLLDSHLKNSPSTKDKILIHNYKAGRMVSV